MSSTCIKGATTFLCAFQSLFIIFFVLNNMKGRECLHHVESDLSTSSLPEYVTYIHPLNFTHTISPRPNLSFPLSFLFAQAAFFNFSFYFVSSQSENMVHLHNYTNINIYVCITLIHSFIHTYIHSFIHSYVHSFIHSFIHT